MINLYKQDGEYLYGIKDFILDSKDDLLNLPLNIRIGSSALIIPTGETYMLNGERKWVRLGRPSNSSGDSGSEDILNYLDADGDGIIDQAEETDAIVLHEL